MSSPPSPKETRQEHWGSQKRVALGWLAATGVGALFGLLASLSPYSGGFLGKATLLHVVFGALAVGAPAVIHLGLSSVALSVVGEKTYGFWTAQGIGLTGVVTLVRYIMLHR